MRFDSHVSQRHTQSIQIKPGLSRYVFSLHQAPSFCSPFQILSRRWRTKPELREFRSAMLNRLILVSASHFRSTCPGLIIWCFSLDFCLTYRSQIMLLFCGPILSIYLRRGSYAPTYPLNTDFNHLSSNVVKNLPSTCLLSGLLDFHIASHLFSHSTCSLLMALNAHRFLFWLSIPFAGSQFHQLKWFRPFFRWNWR